MNTKSVIGYPGIAPSERPFGPAPLSPAIAAGPFLFLSGQVGMDPATGRIAAPDVAGQTRRTLDNVKLLVEAAGLTMDSLVKVTVFLRDVADFGAMNAVYREYFTEPFPARSTVGIMLPNDELLVEIEAVAYRA